MAAYHQHYLKSTFYQPRILRACPIPGAGGEMDNVRFVMSHKIEYELGTNADGFTACCESSYGKKYATNTVK